MNRKAKNAEGYRLVSTFELLAGCSGGTGTVRLEVFRSLRHPERFRFRLFALQNFHIRPAFSAEDLIHEMLTTVSLPNGGSGDYYRARSTRLAEKKRSLPRKHCSQW